MDAPFALRYLETIGSALSLHERAKAGKLHDYVTDAMLVELIAEGVAPPSRLSGEIRHACYVGQLKAARTIPGDPGVPVTTGGIRGDMRTAIVNETETVYIIHRDDARRYFAALDMVPPEGSALHCWLYRTAEGTRKPKNQREQAKADFRQMCMEHWERSPATGISTPGGVVEMFGKTFRHWGDDTLHNWVKDDAPAEVRRPGRPRKQKTPV